MLVVMTSKLAMLRATKGWSQTELREVSGVNRDLISKLENGHLKQVNILQIIRLAGAFEMPVDEFAKWIDVEIVFN